MTMRGRMLGFAYRKGLGRCRVFHNLDSTNTLILVPLRGPDREYLVARTLVTFVK